MDIDSPTISARAPAYALESDNSDSDWDEELAASAPRTKVLTPDAKVELVGSVPAGCDVVFLIGEAGERLSAGVTVESEAATVLVDGEQVAEIRASSAHGPTIVFLSSALPLAALHPLASAVLDALSPRTATILASYHSPSYLTPTPFATSPILYLRSTASAPLAALTAAGVLHPFSPPNLVHGLPASLLTLATLADIPTVLVLIPTVAAPQPLNGPFTPTTTWTGRNTAGGPDPDGAYSELKGSLLKLKDALGWSWWSPAEVKGDGFAWLERQRKARRKDQMSSMYM